MSPCVLPQFDCILLVDRHFSQLLFWTLQACNDAVNLWHRADKLTFIHPCILSSRHRSFATIWYNSPTINSSLLPRPHDFEIIVIDDNSPDGTQEIVKKLQKHYGLDKLVSLFLILAYWSDANWPWKDFNSFHANLEWRWFKMRFSRPSVYYYDANHTVFLQYIVVQKGPHQWFRSQDCDMMNYSNYYNYFVPISTGICKTLCILEVWLSVLHLNM